MDDSDDEEVLLKKKKEGLFLENKERIELEEMFSRDDKFFDEFLGIDKTVDNETYVQLCIK